MPRRKRFAQTLEDEKLAHVLQNISAIRTSSRLVHDVVVPREEGSNCLVKHIKRANRKEVYEIGNSSRPSFDYGCLP